MLILIKTTAKKPASKNKDDKSSEQQVPEDKFLRLTIYGRYENLLAFIYRLEAMPYYIDIKSVSVNVRGSLSRDSRAKDKNLQEDLEGVVIIKVFKKQPIDDQK